MRNIFSLILLLSTLVGYGQPVLPSTALTRDFLRSETQADARTALGLSATAPPSFNIPDFSVVADVVYLKPVGAMMTNYIPTNTLIVAPWGNNSTAKRGSTALAWQTISNACVSAGNNENVVVFGGNYTNTGKWDFYADSDVAGVLIKNKTNFVLEGLNWPRYYCLTSAHMIAVYKCSNIVVRGLHLESVWWPTGWVAAPLAGGVFAHLTYCDVSQLTIENNRFLKGTDHGILHPSGSWTTHESTNQIVIRNNYFKHFGHWAGDYYLPYWDGAAIVCGSANIYGNEIEHVARGVECYGTTTASNTFTVVEGNRFINTLDYGVGSVTWNPRVTVRNNTIYNFSDWRFVGTTNQGSAGAPSRGIEIGASVGSQVHGNFIYGKSDGIALFESGTMAPIETIVTGNSIHNVIKNGIVVQSLVTPYVSNVVVSGNTIIRSGADGIIFYKVRDSFVTGNYVLDCSVNNEGYGIRNWGASYGNYFMYNVITDNGPAQYYTDIAIYSANDSTNNVYLANKVIGVPNAYSTGGYRINDLAFAHNGSLVTTNNANHIYFGSTNVAPTTPGTIDKWVQVRVNGEATDYKIPMYK